MSSLNKTSNTLKLIDGEFSCNDAKEILMNIFANKIQYHEKKNLHSIITTGKSDDNSQLRIDQLKQNVEELNQIIEEAQSNYFTIKLKSDIEIQFLKNKK